LHKNGRFIININFYLNRQKKSKRLNRQKKDILRDILPSYKDNALRLNCLITIAKNG
jgi:hypothetical protein